MARAKGSNAKLRLAFETTYGTVPGSGFAELPFAEFDHGEEQTLLDNDVLGLGRDTVRPSRGPKNDSGSVTVPVDIRNIGYWLKAAFGPSLSTNKRATGSITFSANPAATSTITLNGVAWTFVASGATGNQTNIQGTLAGTLTQLATDLNASANASIDDARYSATATALNIEHKTPGTAGNAFALAASTSPASNGTVSGATLAGGGWEHIFRSGGPRARGTITFASQPANNATITLGGVTWTFVTGTPAGNQSKIGADLAETLAGLAVDLNASVNATLALATYASSATVLTIELDAAGIQAAFSLAASGAPASNGTVSGANLALAGEINSFAAELAFPDADNPSFFVTAGNKLNQIGFSWSRDGLAQASVQLIGQSETRNASTSAGTPTVVAFERFSQAQGSIKKSGSAIANVTGFTLDLSNNLDPVPTIRSDGRIDGADDGLCTARGRIDARFAETASLLAPSEAATAVALEFGYIKSALEQLTFTLPQVDLPKPKQRVSGPNGVQASYDFMASAAAASTAMCTATLRNDVASY